MIAVRWLFALAACAPLGAAACGVMTNMEQRAADRVDLDAQVEIVKTLAAEASLIVVARAVSVSDDARSASFAVEGVLKGHADSTVALRWEGGITVGCKPSVGFFNIRIVPGATYVVYVDGGLIRRAGAVERGHDELTFRHEQRLLRRLGRAPG